MLKIQSFTIGPLETNCYVAYDSKTKEAILIDPAVFDKKIKNFIEDHNLNVKFIVNTHGHPDHIGGNEGFGYPVLLSEDHDTIKIKNISFKIIHTPGHTPDSIILECEDVLFTGDTLFCEGVGRTDLPFGSMKDLTKSLEKLMQYSDDVRIYPGHGPSSTIGHERKYNPFLCVNG